MNKNKLINEISEDIGKSRNEIAEVIESFMKVVKKALKEEGKVTLMGFGSLRKKQSAPRIGRNPKTGETVKIPAKNTVKFKPGKEFIQYIN
jgi:DNA-binding protein HU-beta